MDNLILLMRAIATFDVLAEARGPRPLECVRALGKATLRECVRAMPLLRCRWAVLLPTGAVLGRAGSNETRSRGSPSGTELKGIRTSGRPNLELGMSRRAPDRSLIQGLAGTGRARARAMGRRREDGRGSGARHDPASRWSTDRHPSSRVSATEEEGDAMSETGGSHAIVSGTPWHEESRAGGQAPDGTLGGACVSAAAPMVGSARVASIEVRWYLRAEDSRTHDLERWIEPFVCDPDGEHRKRFDWHLARVFPVVGIKERGKGGLEVRLRIAARPCRSRPAPRASANAG